jgi:hypothetical protein
MAEFDELTRLGQRGRVPRRSIGRRTDRGTGRWVLLLTLAGALFVALPALALALAVSN